MEEASAADKIVIIDNGKIIVHDTSMKLKEKYTSNILRVLPKDEEKLYKYLDDKGYEYKVKVDSIDVMVKNSLESLQILKAIETNLSSFEVLEGNMDSVFISLTGKAIRSDKMKTLIELTKRDLLIFVRNKTAVFLSFLSVIIILGLYVLFLSDLQVKGIEDALGKVEGAKALVNSG